MSVDHSAKENTRATCSHECRAVGDEVSVQPELSLGQLMRRASGEGKTGMWQGPSRAVVGQTG